jgi:hypothetical protein
MALVLGCTGEKSSTNGMPDDPTVPPVGPGTTVDAGPCEDGSTRSCTVTLNRQGNVLTCYKGTETCAGGSWSACRDGVASQLVAEDVGAGALSTLAFGPPPVNCVNNPCDPYCRKIEEKPEAGIRSDSGSSVPPWTTGTIGGLPGGLVNKGLKQPCVSGFDCQFNHYCKDVASGTTCAHHKCTVGGALLSACDPCVADICAAHPTCCTPADTCEHDTCETGDSLKAGCDSCVDKVCAIRSSCCSKSGSWDSTCANLARTTCMKACPCKVDEVAGPDKSRCYFFEKSDEKDWVDARTACTGRGTGWNLATIDDQTENDFIEQKLSNDTWIGLNDRTTEGTFVWSSGSTSTFRSWDGGEPSSGDCVNMSDNDGDWSVEDCDDDEDYVCEGPAGAAPTPSSWTKVCVDAVKSVCAAQCGVGDPPASGGVCTPWLPGQKDSTCSGVDLAVGVPCNDNIPVCNHGSVEAPAGIKLIHFPANSNQYPSCNPDQTHPQMYTCATAEPIPPGTCINVKGCPQLVGNREIMVNPSGAGHVAECTCRDNWSLYSGGTCEPASCSGSSSVATFKPVNMFIMFDKSGSMGTSLSGGGTRWTASAAALTAFFQDTRAAGLGVALRFFPDDRPTAGCNEWSCSATACSDPLVALGDLAATSAPGDTQEALLVAAVAGTAPGGSTPTYPALDGPLRWAVARTQADPNEIYVTVLVTDGEPTECNTSTTAIRKLATDAYNGYGVRTYTIGIAGSNVTELDALALAGGTGKAFVVDGSNSSTMRDQLVAALLSIAGTSASCSFNLPGVGTFDPNNVSVTYKPGTGGSTMTLSRVPNAATCGNGWYYNDNTAPTMISLCPTTCATVQADKGAVVETRLGCPGAYTTSTTSQIYEAVCPTKDGAPQWGHFTYNTSTPLDSNVVFKMRTAATQAALGAETFITVGTAALTPSDTQVCSMSGPAPCPINLYGLLKPAARYPFLELSMTLTPTSNKAQTATINDWGITFSCPPAH